MRFGYANLTLEITGYQPEKFINIAAKRKLFFKNIKYIGKNKIHADIDFAGFKQLRPVAFKSRCRMHILNKRGKIYLLKKMRARKIFFIEGLCSLIIIFLLSSLIGYIEINAPVTVNKQQILDLLYKNDVYEGVYKYSVDDEMLAKKIVLEIDNISWAEVTIKGMRLKIDIAESVPKPEIVPYTEPCNIVAAKDGIIHSMDIKNGTTTVSLGSTVAKGDTIVSGVMLNKFDETKSYTVHSHGDVLARTWYEGRQIVNTVEVRRERTGEYFENSSIEILGLKLNWFNKKNKYPVYDSVSKKDNILLWGFIRLPISIVNEKYFECSEEIIEIDGEKALNAAKESAYEKCLDQIPDSAEIIDVKISYEPAQNDGICVVVIVECIEDIGEKVMISE